jgi:hypothetical protein
MAFKTPFLVFLIAVDLISSLFGFFFTWFPSITVTSSRLSLSCGSPGYGFPAHYLTHQSLVRFRFQAYEIANSRAAAFLAQCDKISQVK